MKKLIFLAVIFAIIAFILSGCFLATQNISGNWTMNLEQSGNTQSTTISITQSGNSIVVDFNGVALQGMISGNNVQFGITISGESINFSGTLSGSSYMSGSWYVSYNGQYLSGTWNATKQ